MPAEASTAYPPPLQPLTRHGRSASACLALSTNGRALWMLDEMNEENGTILLPGSHMAAVNPSVPGVHEPMTEHPAEQRATGKAGSVLIIDSRLWHCIPPNPTVTRPPPRTSPSPSATLLGSSTRQLSCQAPRRVAASSMVPAARLTSVETTQAFLSATPHSRLCHHPSSRSLSKREVGPSRRLPFTSTGSRPSHDHPPRPPPRSPPLVCSPTEASCCRRMVPWM